MCILLKWLFISLLKQIQMIMMTSDSKEHPTFDISPISKIYEKSNIKGSTRSLLLPNGRISHTDFMTSVLSSTSCKKIKKMSNYMYNIQSKVIFTNYFMTESHVYNLQVHT